MKNINNDKAEFSCELKTNHKWSCYAINLLPHMFVIKHYRQCKLCGKIEMIKEEKIK
jgi:hypothetical protein